MHYASKAFGHQVPTLSSAASVPPSHWPSSKHSMPCSSLNQPLKGTRLGWLPAVVNISISLDNCRTIDTGATVITTSAAERCKECRLPWAICQLYCCELVTKTCIVKEQCTHTQQRKPLHPPAASGLCRLCRASSLPTCCCCLPAELDTPLKTPQPPTFSRQ